jgi:hypothetical protein
MKSDLCSRCQQRPAKCFLNGKRICLSCFYELKNKKLPKRRGREKDKLLMGTLNENSKTLEDKEGVK